MSLGMWARAVGVARPVASRRPRNTVRSPRSHSRARRRRHGRAPRRRPALARGAPWRARTGRAASLTGSPITVYSKRCSAPTLPATENPGRDADPEADLTHLAVEAVGEAARRAQGVARGIVAVHRGPEHAEGGVALELEADRGEGDRPPDRVDDPPGADDAPGDLAQFPLDLRYVRIGARGHDRSITRPPEPAPRGRPRRRLSRRPGAR
jgi:hypothetical protein